MSRVLALNKKIDLSDVADGWKGAYIKLSPMLTADMGKLAKENNPDEKDIDKLTEQMLSTIKSKFLEGKVAIEQDDGSTTLDDMTKDDIDSLPFDTLSNIFTTVIGSDFDPKAIVRAQNNAQQPTTDVPATVTQS